MADKKRSLRERALSGGLWTLVSAMASNGIRFASTLLMTRMLMPEIFGLTALTSGLYTIISLLSDIGLKNSIIYSERGADQDFVDTVWTMSAIRGVIIFTISALISFGIYVAAHQGMIAADSVYAHPDLPLVLAGTALAAVWMGFKSPKVYLLERNFDFKRSGIIDLAQQFAGVAATIILTFYWRSVWAIVIGTHVSALVLLWLSHAATPGPRGSMRINRPHAVEIIRYGRWILLSSVAFVLAQNADRLMLGAVASSAMLGFYTLSLNLVFAIDQIASRPFNSVGLSTFAEVGRSGAGDLRRIYYRFRRPFDLYAILFAGFLFASAQLIIDALYDNRYASASRTLQILSFSLLFPRMTLGTIVQAAMGKPQAGSWLNVIKLVSIVTLIPLGYALGGFDGAVWGIAFHLVPGVLYVFWRNREIGLNDFRHEALVVLLWPVGYAIGWLGELIGRPVLTWIGFNLN